MEKSEIQAVEMVRKIRDEQAGLLSGKSEEEVLTFFRAAAQRAQERAKAHGKPQHAAEKGA
jgi:hypothetical protein